MSLERQGDRDSEFLSLQWSAEAKLALGFNQVVASLMTQVEPIINQQ